MKSITCIELCNEIISCLKALGYSTELSNVDGKVICTDIKIKGELKPRHMKMVEMLSGGFLSEFYFSNDIHHVYLRKECNGLLPDDNRYSCLLYEVNKVQSSEDKTLSYNREAFCNKGDHFERVIR